MEVEVVYKCGHFGMITTSLGYYPSGHKPNINWFKTRLCKECLKKEN